METKLKKVNKLIDLLWQINCEEQSLIALEKVGGIFKEKFGIESSLSIEEQKQKIKELKNKYNRLALDLVALNFTDV